MRRLALVVCVTMLPCISLAAQAAGRIDGSVRTPTAAAPGARVEVRGHDEFTAVTDSGGRFALRDVPAGEYTLIVTRDGSSPGSANVRVHGGDTIRVVITLARVAKLATVTVHAHADASYAVDSVRGASKFPVPLLDLPQDIAVVDRAVIDDRAITEVRDLTKNVSGVIAQPNYGGPGLNEVNFVFRGVSSDVGPSNSLRDGFREFSLFTARDMVSVERVEFLKGPASVMFGAMGSIGGLANFISRAPLAAPAGELMISADDFGTLRSTLDLGGPLSTSVRYRLDLAAEHLDSYRAYSDGVGYSVAPAIAWTAGANTTLLFSAQYTERQFRSDPWLPMYPGVLSLPISNFYGEPAQPRNASTGAVVQLTLSQRLSTAWTLREGLSWARGRTADHGYAFLGTDSLETTLFRLFGKSADASKDFASQTEFVGDFTAGAMRQRVVAGIELSTENHTHWDTSGDSLASISLQHPVYGAVPSDTGVASSTWFVGQQAGIYAQDLIDLSKSVKLVLGARFDLYRAHTAGQGIYWGTVPPLQTSGNHLTPRAGLVVQPSRTTSFYASWSRSFAPSLNVPSFGEPTFPPEQGEQFELGVKRESEDGRFSATLAVYELANHNVLVPDLADPLNQRWKVGGLQRSQGIEIDATGNLSPGLAVVLAYAYTDAWVAPNEDDPLAHAYPNQPRHRGSLWAKYTAQSGALRGAAAGAGVTAADGQYADFDAGLHLPGYTIVDAMLGYQFRAVTFQFNFDNLTDARTYQAAGQAVVPGAPRSARTSVAYRW